MATITINLSGKCDKAGRQANQDNYWICPDLGHISEDTSQDIGDNKDVVPSNLGTLLVVADGMGGMNAGEKASELIVAGIQSHFKNIPYEILTDSVQIEAFMKEAITAADRSVKEYASQHPEASGLGSTIAMAWVRSENVHTAWCGDSRIYCFNPSNGLVRLSHDHSYVQRLVDEGKLDAGLAFDHPDTNIITRCLGDNNTLANPECRTYEVHRGDIFLLCSDGLCGLIRDSHIEEVLADNATDMDEALTALWNAGIQEGFTDNCTIILLRVADGGIPPKGVARGYDAPVRKQKPLPTTEETNTVVSSDEEAEVDIVIEEEEDSQPIDETTSKTHKKNRSSCAMYGFIAGLMLLLGILAAVAAFVFLMKSDKKEVDEPTEQESRQEIFHQEITPTRHNNEQVTEDDQNTTNESTQPAPPRPSRSIPIKLGRSNEVPTTTHDQSSATGQTETQSEPANSGTSGSGASSFNNFRPGGEETNQDQQVPPAKDIPTLPE